MPPPLSAALSAWQFSPVVSAPLAVLAACYLTAARRSRRRPAPRRWPGMRTLAFLAGLGVIAVATQGWAGVHDETLPSAHMTQHLLLIMVAPPLLVVGRPVTLLLHATRNPWHTRVKRLLRSPAVTALTWPPVGVTGYSAVVAVTHLTGLFLAGGAWHDGEHLLYLAAGYLFFLPVIGSEPGRWRVPSFGRYLLLLAAMPADIGTGAALMLHGPLAPYSAGDVRAAGLVMVAGADLIMTVLAVALAVGVVRERAADARREPDLAAYNAYLASLDK